VSVYLEPYDLWPDMEKLVVGYLKAALDGVIVTTETSALGDTFGVSVFDVIRVNSVPGGFSDGLQQEATIDVQSFAKSRADAWTRARTVHALMYKLAGTRTPNGAIDDVNADVPGESSYGNPNLRRIVATYRLTSRAQATA